MLLLALTTSVSFSQSKHHSKKMGNSANKEIALGLSRAIMTGQWDKVDALLADDFTYIGDGQPAIVYIIF